MDLKSKLARLPGAGVGPAPATPRPKPDNLPATARPVAPSDGLHRPGPAAAGTEGARPLSDYPWRAKLAEKVKGPAARAVTGGAAANGPIRGLSVETRQTPHGVVYGRVLPFGEGHRHGRIPVLDAARVDPALVARLALDPQFGAVAFERALMLDLETTGLAGGTGTLPILIGLAYYEGGRLVVEQQFLRRPGEETPMLRLLAERIARSSCLITYNGRSFDWPLLKSRFVMNRLPVPEAPPHLDLLHCSRRVYRYLECGGRLADVEREVIGHRRVDDVDGSLIPDLYFRYLRNGNATPLAGALEHNVQDLLLLAALLADLTRKFERPEHVSDPRESLGFATVAFRADDEPRALGFARAASEGAKGPIAAQALGLEARLWLRMGRVGDALTALRAAMPHAEPSARPALHLAIAKVLEHRVRDFEEALVHAQLTVGAEESEAHSRRVHRLKRRLGGATVTVE